MERRFRVRIKRDNGDHDRRQLMATEPMRAVQECCPWHIPSTQIEYMGATEDGCEIYDAFCDRENFWRYARVYVSNA